MCGVSAIFSTSSIPNLEEILDKSNESLRHRGPDSNGKYMSENHNYGLGHTRLSILDLSQISSQPFIKDNYILSFNGEIYNFLELRKVCIDKGSIFLSEGDTEVLIELYRHFGSEFIPMLRGMWAFVLIDEISDKVLISRDFFGIKPLYYGFVGNKLFFSSEIKTFHSLSMDFLVVDEITVNIARDFKAYDRGNWTFYKNIKRFNPGHYLEFSLSEIPGNIESLVFNQYFDIRSYRPDNTSYNESYRNIRDSLNNSVDIHLRSDVPVGVTLSGGIDSSIVALSVARTKNKISTFTTRFPMHKDIDESDYAKEIITKLDAIDFYAYPTIEDLEKKINQLIHFQDEPFGSLSIYSQSKVFEKVQAERVKVVIGGQGADELLFGYPGFFSTYISYLIRDFHFFTLLKRLKEFRSLYNYRFGFLKGLRKFLLDFNRKSHSDYYCISGKNDTYETRKSFIYRKCESFEDFLIKNLIDENLPALLRYEDRNSMMYSVESRLPFLDIDFVAVCLKAKVEYKIKDGRTKSILRDAFKSLLPFKIYSRFDKFGFPAPDSEWLTQILNKKINKSFSCDWTNFILSKWQDMNIKRRADCKRLL